MLDLMWAISNPNAYEWARWAPEDRSKYKNIKVEKISDTEKRRNPIYQNLMTNAKSVLLSTIYANDYKPRQQIYYRGKWHVIINVTENEKDIVPQQALLLGANVNKEYYLEIIEKDVSQQ